MDVFSTLVTDQVGVVAMKVGEIELDDDGNESEITDDESNAKETKKSVDTPLVLGAVVAGLVMFVLTLVCFVFCSQRRPRASAMNHSRFEDELDVSNSVAPQMISSDTSAYKDDKSASYQYETRVIPLAEENFHEDAAVPYLPSSLEDWLSFSPEDEDNARRYEEADDIFWTNHPRDRVHQCSAATCEVCERRRQQGVRLWRQNRQESVELLQPPSPERIPSSDPNRLFSTGDTVQF